MRLSSSTCVAVLLAGTVVSSIVAAAAVAAQPASRPLSQPSAAGMAKLTGVISKVEGPAQMKLTEGGEWEPARERVEVPEGAEFRTGRGGMISILLPPDQE